MRTGISAGARGDLGDARFELEMVHFLEREAGEELEAAPDEEGDGGDLLELLLFAAGELGGIGDAPMGDDGVAGPAGAFFPSRIADGDDEVERDVLEFGDALAAGGGGVDFPGVPEVAQDEGIDLAGGMDARAADVETARSEVAQEEFGKDAAGRIAGAEEEDLGLGRQRHGGRG